MKSNESTEQEKELRRMRHDHETAVGASPKLDAVCAGNPWEMGYAQGSALRSRIHSAFSILDQLEAFRLLKPAWMPFSVFRSVAAIKAGRYLSTGVSDHLPECFSRLEGLAQGAGVSWRALCLINAIEPVLSDIGHTTVAPVVAACSALAVTKRASAYGNPILAHNFDYLPVTRPLYSIRESRPHGMLRSLEFTAAPLAGTVDGINEAGLAITYNYAYVTDSAHRAPTISMWTNQALSCCRTVSEAVDYFSRAKWWGGGLLMLGDASGEIASLEFSNTRSRSRMPADHTDYLFHTNSFETRKMKDVEIPGCRVFGDLAPRALRGRRVHQSSEARNERFRERLFDTGPLDVDGVAELMSDHGRNGRASADTICMHSDHWHTTACVQLLPTARQMRIAYGTACNADYITLEL